MCVNKKLCKIMFLFVFLVLMPLMSYSKITAEVDKDNGTVTINLSKGEQFKLVFGSSVTEKEVAEALKDAGLNQQEVKSAMMTLSVEATNTIANDSSTTISASELLPSFTPY
jgi:hypothetical protein